MDWHSLKNAELHLSIPLSCLSSGSNDDLNKQQRSTRDSQPKTRDAGSSSPVNTLFLSLPRSELKGLLLQKRRDSSEHCALNQSHSGLKKRVWVLKCTVQSLPLVWVTVSSQSLTFLKSINIRSLICLIFQTMEPKGRLWTLVCKPAQARFISLEQTSSNGWPGSAKDSQKTPCWPS